MTIIYLEVTFNYNNLKVYSLLSQIYYIPFITDII